jgi:ribosomal protein S18 acetylase RimI-like enzyme
MITLNDILIRTELLPGDLGYIAYLHGSVYPEECGYGLNFEGYVLESLGEFAHQYDPAKDRVWVCEHHQKIIGFLAGVHRGESVQLRYFIFLPEYRGIGLGKKLMDLFMEYMHEQGIKKAYLWTTNEQHTATALYARYGFKLAEEKSSTAFDKPLVEQRYDLVMNDPK